MALQANLRSDKNLRSFYQRMKKLRPASSTLGARKPNTLGTEARIGISTASFVKDVYGEDHNILPVTRGLANRRRPRSGPLRGTLLDPHHTRSSSSKMATNKRVKLDR